MSYENIIKENISNLSRREIVSKLSGMYLALDTLTRDDCNTGLKLSVTRNSLPCPVDLDLEDQVPCIKDFVIEILKKNIELLTVSLRDDLNGDVK